MKQTNKTKFSSQHVSIITTKETNNENIAKPKILLATGIVRNKFTGIFGIKRKDCVGSETLKELVCKNLGRP